MNCNNCDYLFINGVGCHETGCPNGRTWTCRECGEKKPYSERYCECLMEVES